MIGYNSKHKICRVARGIVRMLIHVAWLISSHAGGKPDITYFLWTDVDGKATLVQVLTMAWRGCVSGCGGHCRIMYAASRE